MSADPTRIIEADPELLLATALRLAAAGHPVFPCVPDQKRPLTRHGLLEATLDPDRIRGWWRRWPTANLALTTGTPGVDVLDVDIRESGTGYPAFDRLTRAGLLHGHSRIILTPSGGLHAYFTGTDQPCSRLPDQHLDFKAVGGYVLVPPSIVAGRRYELIRRTPGPHTLLDWTAVRALLAPPTAPARLRRGAIDGIQPLARWVSKLPEGQRNTGTFWAACRALEQGHTDLRPLIEAAITAGLPAAEAARTITSALHRITNLTTTPTTTARTAGQSAASGPRGQPPRQPHPRP